MNAVAKKTARGTGAQTAVSAKTASAGKARAVSAAAKPKAVPPSGVRKTAAKKVTAKQGVKVTRKVAAKTTAKAPEKAADETVARKAARKTAAADATTPGSAPKTAAAKRPARRTAGGAASQPDATIAASGADAGTPAQQIVAAGPATRERVRKTRVAGTSEASVDVQIGGLTPTATRPGFWDRACADLIRRDRILKKIIPQFGPVHLIARGEPFVTLARSVVGQQISVKAAQAIWDRIVAACPTLAPAAVVVLGLERLAACGLSKRKAEYILDLAHHFVNGSLHVHRWVAMDDEAVIAELVQIRGIGRWTAEMFLIFNLLRPDVLPLDDLGLIRAISVNYFSGEPVTRSEAREVAANWEPWRTVATWYMWRSLDPIPVDY
ncbi:MAG: DNA repair protein [Janthinobacterium lividum]